MRTPRARVAEPVEDASRPPEPDADPESVARTICLALLTRRAHTRAELAAALARRRVPEDVVRRVLDRFGDVRLIDDAAFAESWVASRRRTRGLGRRALAAELRQRGVGDDEVASALASVTPDEERATAVALVERKLASMRGLDRAVQERRLVSLLARRGYPSSLAYAVVRAALGEPPAGG